MKLTSIRMADRFQKNDLVLELPFFPHAPTQREGRVLRPGEVAPQTSVCLETDVASPFPSHEVATAYSLGH